MPVNKAKRFEDKDYIELSTIFIDKFMPKANGVYVKVYLLGLRQCFSENPIDIKAMAKQLDMLESEVTAGWNYWESMGIVTLIPLSGGGGFDVEFEDLVHLKNKSSVIINETRPTYGQHEIMDGIARNMLMPMVEHVSNILGKPLSTPEISTIYSFYDWLRLPVEIIPMLVSHCVGMDKSNMRYIERVAISWADKGINTYEKAEEYLKQFEEDYSKIGKIKKKIGITGRQLTESESKYINKWIKDMSMTLEVIVLAGEITVGNTGKISFAYMDKILQDWYQKGVKTVKQAEIARQITKPTQKKTEPTASKQSKGVSTFTGKKIDFDAIEKKAKELLDGKNKN